MYKIFFITFQVIIVLFLSILLINYSFNISFEFNDLIFSVSSTYLAIFIFTFFLIIFLFQSLYFKTRFKFEIYKIKKKMGYREKGYKSFVAGMVALSNKDYNLAIRESKKISKHIDDNSSLYLLLKSETYKLEKKYEELTSVYEQMIKDKNTKNLGFRGLMEQYLRAQDYHHAFIYGEKLFNNNPHIEKIYETLLNIITKTNNWHQLIIITDKAFSNKIINKKQYNENKSIAFYEISQIKKYSDSKESLIYVKKALKLRENFPPYIKLYFDLLIQDGQFSFAKKYIRKMWKVSPHLEYRESLLVLAQKIKIDLLDLIKFVVVGDSNAEESKILIVEASIFDKKWDTARKEIRELLGDHPKKEVCLLMAEIEGGENNDIQKKNSWILRSRDGKNNKIWICSLSHKEQYSWTSISKGGFFNSLEWREPNMLNQIQIKDNRSLSYEN